MVGYSNNFFKALNVDPNKTSDVKRLAQNTSIPLDRLIYYNENNILPIGKDMMSIERACDVSEPIIKVLMGYIDDDAVRFLRKNPSLINDLEQFVNKKPHERILPEPIMRSEKGVLYEGDCMDTLNGMEDESVDMIFADPPFNLNKLYPSNINDNLREEKYIEWSNRWIIECIRVLKHGGSFFLWNLPKWNVRFASVLERYLTFRHWIAVDIKYRLPIKGRLYPSHYSLLYFVKGKKPNVFHPDRLPMEVCPKCYTDLKDYGGYKNKMNPKGVNISDVWTDIPPVRHQKYKRREGANELSIKLMDRVIEMSTEIEDIVFDPFGGAGTTYITAEIKKRRWIGCEIGPCDDIIKRFDKIDEDREILNGYRSKINKLFTDDIKKKRNQLGLWTTDSL